jgi:hypothetical protein
MSTTRYSDPQDLRVIAHGREPTCQEARVFHPPGKALAGIPQKELSAETSKALAVAGTRFRAAAVSRRILETGPCFWFRQVRDLPGCRRWP